MNKQTLLSYLIEAVIFIAIIACLWGYYDRKLDISDQNLLAFRGKLEQVELKNGELLSSRDSYVATINDLEELLGIAKQEVRDMQRQLNSKIAYIAKLEQNTRVEYIEVVKDSIIYVNSSPQKVIASFHYNDNWLSFNGENEFTPGDKFDYKTTLHNIQMNTPLTVGLTNDYKIFVKSENPYVNFSSIEGAVIDKQALKPRKQRFGWGLQLGIGAMYDVVDKDVAVGPYAGLGVELNF
jgi:uncharacterized protein with NAD-binding domain and iron-sulfur cluster